MLNASKLIIAVAPALALNACGTYLPVMDLNHNTDAKFKIFVQSIAQHVRCELQKAVAIEYEPTDPNRKLLFDWAAQVALTIRARDEGAINSNISALDKMLEFTFSASGRLEANSTREMTMTYYLPFSELLNNRKSVQPHLRVQDCDSDREPSVVEPIAGNLGIHQSLKAALETWDISRTLSDRVEGGPFDTITHHVIFAVIAGGTATPAWRFVRLSANTAQPFIGAARTQTDELLITMGPTQLGTRKLRAPSIALNQSFQIERLRSVINR